MLYAGIARRKSVFKGIFKMMIMQGRVFSKVFSPYENRSYGENWWQHEADYVYILLKTMVYV
jgi:hypothetical protein